MAREENLLACPICLDNIKDPKMISECGHTFCQNCLQAVVNAGRLQCPLCRKPFRRNQVVPNFALQQLLDDTRWTTAAAPGLPETSAPPLEPLAPAESPHRPGPSLENLTQQWGFPAELARLVAEEAKQVYKRIYLLDNSGSTAAYDGQILDAQSGTWRGATRWEEVCDMAVNHARWALELNVPAEFVLLNPRAGMQSHVEGQNWALIDSAHGSPYNQVQALQTMLQRTGPGGLTPIADRMARIRTQLQGQVSQLAQTGQKVILILVTDGLPTTSAGQKDHRGVVQELRAMNAQFMGMFHLVIRLCCNDDSVADYYGKIDKELELNMELVDDMRAEARECHRAGNRFFTYSPMLHLLREAGTFVKVLDLLDERRLSSMEVMLVCQLIARTQASDPPMPTQTQEFLTALRRLLPKCQPVTDPNNPRQRLPPLNDRQVELALQPPRAGDVPCAACCPTQ